MGVMTQTAARALDHLVLPAASLDTARDRLTALGFTVAPTGVHPFGTQNCCIYFADRTFLEPLAVGDATQRDAAMADGNVFVTRDNDFRAAHGDDGFSAIVFGSGDAAADHAGYVADHLSAGEMLSFSRPFVDTSGKEDTASFRLAFAVVPSLPERFFFACERVNAPAVDRSALERHENGATRLLGVTVVSGDPAATAAEIAQIAGSEASSEGDSHQVALPNGRIDILDRKTYAGRFGIEPAIDGAGFALVSVGVDDVKAVKALLPMRGIASRLVGGGLLVPAAPGQGAAFFFEETE